MTAPDVELHIDELVLHGLSGIDGARVGEAVRRELQRLLTVEPLRAGALPSIHLGNLDLGRVHPNGPHGAEALGTSLAHVIHGRMVR